MSYGLYNVARLTAATILVVKVPQWPPVRSCGSPCQSGGVAASLNALRARIHNVPSNTAPRVIFACMCACGTEQGRLHHHVPSCDGFAHGCYQCRRFRAAVSKLSSKPCTLPTVFAGRGQCQVEVHSGASIHAVYQMHLPPHSTSALERATGMHPRLVDSDCCGPCLQPRWSSSGNNQQVARRVVPNAERLFGKRTF